MRAWIGLGLRLVMGLGLDQYQNRDEDKGKRKGKYQYEDMDARLANIKAQYLATSKELVRLRERLEASKARTKGLRDLMEAIKRGSGISEQECQRLGITRGEGKPDGLFLRYRIQGLLRDSEREEAILSDRIASLEQLAKELEVCPKCGGRGKIQTKLEYETMEGGIVIPRIEEEPCELCKGRGRLQLSSFQGLE
jgi:chromosome segregation ATPase